MKTASFEHVLEQVGSQGRHQKLLIWLYVLPLNFFIPWMVLTPIFLSSTPAYHCAPPPHDAEPPFGDHVSRASITHLNSSAGDNFTEEVWWSVAIPKKDGKTEQCRQYNMSWSDIAGLASVPANTNFSLHISDNYGIVDCQHGKQYDQSDFKETLPMSLGWVCDSEHFTAMWLSVGLAGNVIGTLAFTSLADIFGRRPLLAITSLVCAVFGCAKIYATSTWTAMLAQFVASMPFPAILELSLIIIYEQVSGDQRSFITSASFVMWTLGSSLLPLVAWLAGTWRLLCLITSLPFFLFVAAYWVLPESPSWLLSRGKATETVELLSTIARRNGKTVPKDLEDQVTLLCGQGKQHHGPLQLFYTPLVRKRTLLLTACYTCNNLFYYGLTYNIDNMSGNQFLNFFLFSITELPANFLGGWMVEVLGRRWSQSSCFFLASACALASLPFIGTSTWITTVMLTISKLFVTISFLVIYIQCAEIYPTSHRSTGTGLSSLVSSCFGTTGPYIAVTSKIWGGLPYLILATIGVAGVLVSSLLPETLGQDLPQTLDDAENYLTDEEYFSFKGKAPCGIRKRKKSSFRPKPADQSANDTGVTEALNSRGPVTSMDDYHVNSDKLHSSTMAILPDEMNDLP
ncbi:organic cation transporter 1 [Hyalella azteca]|uniref:Organic cation transporter 1 n=1 Tax=Hyalella azteca TaxID=294128 RepID=A0A8B7N5T0_HYAAZ|nr:organic cation transporter 1 [Hyalella azteca]